MTVSALGSEEVTGHGQAGAMCMYFVVLCPKDLPAEVADQGRLQGGGDHRQQY